ncbi:MAG: 3'(2'),5'-bisphosphate nucleotidase CysQ [Alphaproteobacteria bacterium]|nr:3'(2'),5'-bisphosphate nucleotidase CysQ [Alphaproteobacteria bacterium]
MDRELRVAVDAARAAAEAIRGIAERHAFTAIDKSHGRGPLTEADLAANAILVDALRTAFPDDGLLSEESKDGPERLGRRRVWIIDPLDGTKEFVNGVPQYVVSVGLAIDGEPAVGVLVNPPSGEVFTGIVGGGATYQGQDCRVTSRSSLEGARLLVSSTEHGKGWFDHLQGVCEVEPMGSVAYKAGLVAAGLADATFTPKPRNEWDLLGGVACIVAAGGRCTDGTGTPYRFNAPDPLKIGVCLTNTALHEAVMGLMQG